jgi:hypothetical protein
MVPMERTGRMGLLALLVRQVCQQIYNLIVKIEMKNA